MAFLLAGLAGWVDAVGLAGSKGVFISFMSGNTTDLAVSFAHRDWTRAGLIGVVLLLFAAGALVGELLEPAGGRRGPTLVLGVEAIFLAAGAAIQWDSFNLWSSLRWLGGSWCCPLVFAMGLQNATMHRAGGISIGLTYVTGTLVQISRSIAARMRGEANQQVCPYLGLWLSLAIGAGFGALALSVSTIAAVSAAAIAAAALAALTAFAPGVIGAGRPTMSSEAGAQSR